MKLVADMTVMGLPDTINTIGRIHWALQAKDVKRWNNAVYQQCVLNRIAGLGLKKATVEFVRHSFTQPDTDNLANSFKYLQDGLVKAGVIIDDNPTVLTATYLWEKAPRNKGYCTIKVLDPEDSLQSERTAATDPSVAP